MIPSKLSPNKYTENHGSLEIQGDWYIESKSYIIWQDKQEQQEIGINTMTAKRLLKKNVEGLIIIMFLT